MTGSMQDFRIDTRADFERMFRDHYGVLCSYANGFLHDLDASEEVVQEVMLKIWENRSSIVFTSSVKSYLFRAVRNGCLNLLKHLSVKEEYRSYREREADTLHRSPEDEVMVSELESKIREAIDRLPIERRKVFIMSRYDGLSYQEIAAGLGISVKTVENQMGKALKTLREELSDYLPFVLLLFYFMDN